MLERRNFIQCLGVFPFLAPQKMGKPEIAVFADKLERNRFKISLNAYSFNKQLTSKEIGLMDLIPFAANQGFEAIDTTGYYFPNYPEVPPDEYIYHLKNKMHRHGLSISGTGIRTEFGSPDKKEREKEIIYTKKWIEVAAKLGVSVLRIFSAKALPDGYKWTDVSDWIIEDFKIIVAHAKTFGVIIGLQNHNDLIKTAEDAMYFVDRLDKEWFGLVADIGSFNAKNAYQEIETVAPYAVNWQIKESIIIDGKKAPVDLDRLLGIIKASSYKGFLPIETLRDGDPFVIVPEFYKTVREGLDKL